MIKTTFNGMTEKPKDQKKEEHNNHSGGEMSFGLEIIIFMVVLFIIWILAGGAQKEQPQSPLLVPDTHPINSLGQVSSD